MAFAWRAGLLSAALWCGLGAAPSAAAQPQAAALQGGVHAQRLQRLGDFMQAATGPQGYLGAVTLVMRGGQVLQWQAHGHRDLARSQPMPRDAIFRIYSMSKTVATVAALMLVEEGKLALDDPVAQHLPEFASLQVLASGTAEAPTLRPPKRPLTIRHLLTHTAGFGTGGEGIEAATALLARANPHGAADLRGFAERVSRAPLAADPGDRFRYDGVQIEVLGRVIEVASGQPLEQFLQRRVFQALKMADTGFEVPPAQRHRIADISAMGPGGRLVLAAGRSATSPGVALNAYPSGAGGLYSTAADYARFCQMLLNAGTLDGVALLGRKTVDLMMTNQLQQRHPPAGLPAERFSASEGFGLGGSVLVDVAARGRPGTQGAFGWSGAASTYYSIDRGEQLVMILLMQHLHADEPPAGTTDLPKLNARFQTLVYQALTP